MKQKPKISQVTDTGSQSFLYKIQQYQPENLGESLSFMLIRPPRFVYNQQLLLPSYKLKDKFKYHTFKIPFPLSLYTVQDMKYVLLYLHGNSSSRFQGYLQLSTLPKGVGLACFDFNGCGLRQQNDFITLGKNQSQQVNIAAKFLKGLGYTVVGWGRSMGSVGLLMSQQCDIMVADSPFSSLSQLCKESSIGFVPKICCCLFHCFYPCVQCWIRSKVRERTGMDPKQLQIIQYVKKIPSHKSLIILAGQQDYMIRSHHSELLFDAFKGKNKKLLIFEGSHNSNRPHQVLKQSFEFINKCLNINMDLSDYPPYSSKIKIKPKKLNPLQKIPKQIIEKQPSIQLKTYNQILTCPQNKINKKINNTARTQLKKYESQRKQRESEILIANQSTQIMMLNMNNEKITQLEFMNKKIYSDQSSKIKLNSHN